MKALERLLVFSLLSIIGAAYGQDAGLTSPPPTQSSDINSPLNGNWHLTGIDSQEMGRSKFPFLAFFIKAEGHQLYGFGEVRADCDTMGGNFVSTVYLVGKVGPDGTFEVYEPHNDPAYASGSTQLIIHGAVPAPGATAWRGTYTLKSSPTRANCLFEHSAAFTAKKYPPFTGTYSGSIAGKAIGAHATATIQVTQGEPVLYSRHFWFIPLNGQITVAGSSCFSTGTATSDRSNNIEGDEARLHFLMDDKSVLDLSASPFAEPKKSTVWIRVSVKGGQCDHASADGILKPR